MSSIAGKIAPPLFGAYSASKFALEGLTDAQKAAAFEYVGRSMAGGEGRAQFNLRPCFVSVWRRVSMLMAAPHMFQ